MSLAFVRALASALLISGILRSDQVIAAKSPASRSAAFRIRGVCTGTLTGRGIAFLHPLAFASSIARSTAAFSPAMRRLGTPLSPPRPSGRAARRRVRFPTAPLLPYSDLASAQSPPPHDRSVRLPQQGPSIHPGYDRPPRPE